jgi:uncharacterized protein (DUF58 family)
MWFRNIFNAKKTGARTTNAGQTPENGAGAAPGALSPQAMHVLNRMRLNTGSLLLSQSAGARSSRQRKPASDFREHRQYVPGDDVRYVDWKASARQEHVFIKQGEQEKAALVYVLIDASASMGWGQPPKSNVALSLAHALGYLALAQQDRLLVLPVTPSASPVIAGQAGVPAGAANRGLHPLGPLWGKGQASQLAGYLQAIRFGGRVDLSYTLAGLSRRNLSRGGLVVVISDLLSVQDLRRGLEALPAPTWQVVVCHLLHPAELDPALDGHLQMVDIETGAKKLYTVTARSLETYRRRLSEWQEQLSQVCREHKAIYSQLSTGWSMETQIIPQLRRDQVVKSL